MCSRRCQLPPVLRRYPLQRLGRPDLRLAGVPGSSHRRLRSQRLCSGCLWRRRCQQRGCAMVPGLLSPRSQQRLRPCLQTMKTSQAAMIEDSLLLLELQRSRRWGSLRHFPSSLQHG